MTTKNYNGWTNYETWVVNLWMDNDAGSQDYWREQADNTLEANDQDRDSSVSDLADTIKGDHETAQPEVSGVFADLLNAAMSEVNWYEIAEHIIDDVLAEKANDKAIEQREADGNGG